LAEDFRELQTNKISVEASEATKWAGYFKDSGKLCPYSMVFFSKITLSTFIVYPCSES
jgi:hypothetical protein